MKILFVIWGGVGFLGSLVTLLSLFLSTSVGTGTSTYVAAVTLIWIGGMVFFGLGSLLFRKAATIGELNADVDPYRNFKVVLGVIAIVAIIFAFQQMVPLLFKEKSQEQAAETMQPRPSPSPKSSGLTENQCLDFATKGFDGYIQRTGGPFDTSRDGFPTWESYRKKMISLRTEKCLAIGMKDED
jgi:hypothetical protein